MGDQMESDKFSRRHFLAGAGAVALSPSFTPPMAGSSVGRQSWIEGTVCDSAGQPLAAARIQIDAMEVASVPKDVRTGKDGSFRVKLKWQMEPGKSPLLFLTVSKRGYVSQVIPIKLSERPSFQLKPKLSPRSMHGFPGSELRFEGIMIDSRTQGAS